MMNFDLELLALIKVAVRDDLDNNQRQSLTVILLWAYHVTHLTVVNPELLFGDLHPLLRELFQEVAEFVGVLQRQVDIHREQTHKRQ